MQDCLNFQLYLNQISSWANEWQLSLAPEKCNILKYNNNKVINYDYNILGIHLNSVNSVTDLGIICNNSLNFSPHINSMCQKARICSLTILRSFHSKNPELQFRAFRVYVRLILRVEYCSPIWNPHKLHDIRRIEAIQKRFTKKLTGMEGKQYMARLQILKADTLENRRLKLDLVLYYKIIHSMTKLSAEKFFYIKKSHFRYKGSFVNYL